MRPRKQCPWFWDADKFSGERVNDVHLTNAEKHAARERAEREIMADQQYTYARFWKCALQVNPAGYSRCVSQGRRMVLRATSISLNCFTYAEEQDIRVVGLADHGSVQDVDAIRDFLSPQGIIVFPGFEISSTEKIHMVCLFAEDTTTRTTSARFLVGWI